MRVCQLGLFVVLRGDIELTARTMQKLRCLTGIRSKLDDSRSALFSVQLPAKERFPLLPRESNALRHSTAAHALRAPGENMC